MAEKMGQMKALVRFFGYKDFDGKTGLQAFNAELKQLSDEEKRELAELAAKELGVEIDWPVTK